MVLWITCQRDWIGLFLGTNVLSILKGEQTEFVETLSFHDAN